MGSVPCLAQVQKTNGSIVEHVLWRYLKETAEVCRSWQGGNYTKPHFQKCMCVGPTTLLFKMEVQINHVSLEFHVREA